MFNSSFVGRKYQLERLNVLFEHSQKENFYACFITGDTGMGKTSLIKKFCKDLNITNNETIIAECKCDAHIGKNSPYAPFVDLLRELTRADQSLKNNDFVKTILNKPDKQSQAFSKEEIFKEYQSILEQSSQNSNIVFVLEDMHWIDEPSILLLEYLLSELNIKKIFLLGSYRTNEVTCTDNKKHPLCTIHNELKDMHNIEQINLHDIHVLEKKNFIRSIFDIEANLLDDEVVETMLQHTNAEPLFTLELLLHMKQNKLIIKNDESKWYIKNNINWNELPLKIEDTIESRIEQLTISNREVLNVASVEGTNFTLQVVSNILNIPEHILIKQIKNDLYKKHNIVTSNGNKKLQNYTLYLFKFVHTIFQKYIYKQLNDEEKKALHLKVAETLELLYHGSKQECLFELAYHYRLSGYVQKAVEYLKKSAERALSLSTYNEALIQLDYAIELLRSDTSSLSNKQLEFEIQILRSTVLKVTTGWVSEQTTKNYEKTREIGKQLKNDTQLAPVIFGLWAVKLMTLELNDALVLANECLTLGQRMQNFVTISQSHIAISNTHFWLGNFKEASEHALYANKHYKQTQHIEHTLKFGYDPLSLGYMFHILSQSAMGNSSEAISKRDEMMSISSKWTHPFSQAICYQADAWMQYHLNNPQAVQNASTKLYNISEDNNFPFYKGMAIILGTWAEAMLDDEKNNYIDKLQNGYKDYMKSSGALIAHSLYRLILSQVLIKYGKNKLALENIDKALTIAYDKNELSYEAELLRLKATLLPVDDSKEVLLKAKTIAQNQGAKLFEQRVNEINLNQSV